MSDADPSPPADAPPPAQKRSWAHNPWLWAVVGLAVVAIGFAVWAIDEHSNANDAKADLDAQKASPPKTSTVTETHTVTEQTEAQTTTDSGDDGEQRVHIGALAAAAAAFGAARKQLNESDAQVDELESEVDKASAEAEKAQQDADNAKAQAESASDAQKKADAEAEQAEAEKRQLGAKARAAANCAKGMLEIVGDIPKAENLDAGLQKAGDDMKAFAPKCKESVASPGS